MTKFVVGRKGTIFLLVFVGILRGVLADTSSPQGFKEVYDHFWSQPIDNWEVLIGERVDEEAYTIKPGDTLSELSEVFFGTPYYWPKIWSLNDYIKNPHLIYPGNKIVFKLGSVSNLGAAPKVLLNPSVNKKDKNLNLQTTPDLGSQESQFLRLGAPTEKVVTYSFNESQEKLPPKPGPPVLQNLPQSFPTWRVKEENKDEIQSIERQYSKLDFNVMQFDLESFLSEGEIDSLGHVVGFLDGEIGQGTLRDTIFVKSAEGNLSIGGVYTLVKFEGKAQTNIGKSIKDAYIYSYLGEVKILKNKLNYGDFFSGQVIKSVSSIPKGTLVVPGKIPVYNLKYDKRNIQNTPAKILRGNRFYGRGIYSVGQTVYLSEGKNGGLNPGSILKIEQDSKFVKIREDDESIDVSRLVGWVKVVKVEESFSTGIVIISHGIISSGDKVVE